MHLDDHLGADADGVLDEAVHRVDHAAAQAVFDRHDAKVGVPADHFLEHGADVRQGAVLDRRAELPRARQVRETALGTEEAHAERLFQGERSAHQFAVDRLIEPEVTAHQSCKIPVAIPERNIQVPPQPNLHAQRGRRLQDPVHMIRRLPFLEQFGMVVRTPQFHDARDDDIGDSGGLHVRQFLPPEIGMQEQLRIPGKRNAKFNPEINE